MFDWDSSKAISNFEKHRISFEEAVTVFVDEEGLDLEDSKHSTSESRRIRIGTSIENRVLTVVYTVRRIDDEKESIRVISARQASAKERKAYSR
jgi:hypothetical protein